MKDIIKKAINQTFNYIYSDLMEITGGEISQADAIELVLDADRLEQHCRDKEALTWFRSLSYDEQIEVAKEVIKYDSYV